MADQGQLQIDFQTGFDRDAIVVYIENEEAWRRSDIRSRYQTGLAESFSTHLPRGAIELRIDLPARHLSLTLNLQLGPQLFIGVNLTDEGRLVHEVRTESFYYM